MQWIFNFVNQKSRIFSTISHIFEAISGNAFELQFQFTNVRMLSKYILWKSLEFVAVQLRIFFDET